MSYHGDIRLGDTIDLKFTSRAFSTGAPTTLSGSPVISAYPSNSTTELTAGITLTVDFDARTGLNHVRVVATSGNGYLTATNYELVITAGTVSGTSVVGEVIGSFSIENRSALMPATAGRTVVIDAAGLADANVVKVGPTGAGTAQTARDIGASVLLSAGAGTGQLDFTSGVVKSNMTQVNGGACPATSVTGVPKVDLQDVLGTLATAATAGILDVNTKNLNNVSTSSVTTINANQGTTQPVNFTGTAGSALVKSDTVDIAGAAVSTTTAQLGVNAVKYNNQVAQTDANGLPKVDAEDWLGTAVTAATAGIPDVNAKNVNNVSAASVTAISANLGTTQPVNFTGTGASALVKDDVTDWAATAVTTPNIPGTPVVDLGNVAGLSVSPAHLGFPTGTNGTIKSTLSWIDNGGAANVSYFNNWCQNALFNGFVDDSVFVPTTTQFEATFSQGAPTAAADAFKNCFVLFIGSLSMGNFAAARVTAYSKQGTKGHFTVTPALPAAPTGSDPFQVMIYGLVVADTVNDKTGYALTAAYDPAKTAAQAGNAMTLTSGERNSTADALLARTLGTEGYAAKGAVPTVAQALFMVLQDMQERSITSTTYTVKKLDGSTTAMTFTLDSSTNPTSKTRAT